MLAQPSWLGNQHLALCFSTAFLGGKYGVGLRPAGPASPSCSAGSARTSCRTVEAQAPGRHRDVLVLADRLGDKTGPRPGLPNKKSCTLHMHKKYHPLSTKFILI